MAWYNTVQKLRVAGTGRPFLRDDRGGVTVFLTPMFLFLLAITGISLDLARQEAERADLQNALDRCVLAAASLRQAVDVKTVCDEYVSIRAFQQQPIKLGVAVHQNGNRRSVVAGVNTRFDTTALALVGLPEFKFGVESAAEESDGRIEISLVLDISGSMAREETEDRDGNQRTRLRVMKDAAKDFVTQTLENANRDETSISLIPFAGQVNAGPFFDMLLADGARQHNYSSCIEFDESIDFDRVELPINGTRGQTPHFQNFFYERLRGQSRLPFDPEAGNEAEWGWCPIDRPSGTPTSRIVPFSNDEVFLNNVIEEFEGHDGTGTPNGLKWGISLLARKNFDQIQRAGSQDGSGMNMNFRDRPSLTGDAQKVLIVMTDGRIRYQPRPELYNDAGDIQKWQFDLNNVHNNRGNQIEASNILYLNQSESTLKNEDETDADQVRQNELALSQCNLAKQEGITVYTIAFGIDESDEYYDEATAFLRNCASTENVGGVPVVNAFEAKDGEELANVFDKLVAEITRLRLFR